MTQQAGTAGEYRAFVPKELPPEPPPVLGEELRDWERRAYAALGRLDGIIRVLPSHDLFLYMYVRKEAVLSSQIEGTQSSLSDLLLFEHEGAASVPLDDVREVSRCVRALQKGADLLKSLPLSMRLLREVHRELVTDARGGDKTPGELRTSQNWIGGTHPGNAAFVPPPHHLVGELLANVEKFLHEDPMAAPTLIKAGLAHAQFETIHPFLDGNGRVGRLLITLTLMSDKILEQPVFYPSLYFKQSRSEYYDRLQRVRTHGEWEEWLQFFIRGVALVAESACATVERTIRLFERDRARVQSTKGRVVANALRVYDYAREEAIVSVPQAAIKLGITQPTVTAAVSLLEGLGILKEVTNKLRDRKYLYAEYVDVLSDERPLS